MASTGSKPRLAKLFMFNSNWGLKEGMENEKIIYFWPNETGNGTQKLDILFFSLIGHWPLL